MVNQPRSAWRFCPRCATPLTAAPPVRCASCDNELYWNSVPTAGAVVVRDDTFLAIRRARDPFAGHWDIPGGFCDRAELPVDTAAREVAEETGVAITIGALVGFYLDTYDFQDETLSILNCYFLATAAADAVPQMDPAEALEVGWLPLRGHPELAFGHEDAVIRDAVMLLGR